MNHMTSTMRKTDNDAPVSTVLAVIESVMKRAEQITEAEARQICNSDTHRTGTEKNADFS